VIGGHILFYGNGFSIKFATLSRLFLEYATYSKYCHILPISLRV
jgi:hypothetical protein